MTNTLDRQCTNILRFLRWMSCKWPTAVIRPVDANETAVAWKVAVESQRRRVLLMMRRHEAQTLDSGCYAGPEGGRCGAFVLGDAEGKPPALILIASGSEVALVTATA